MSNTTNDPEQKYGEREPSMTVDQMYEEWQKCLKDADYFREKYCAVKDDTMHWHIPNWMKAFEMIQPIKREGSAANQHFLNKLMGDIQAAEAKREPHEKPKLDLKFNPDGTHVHTIIQYVKKCGAAAYHKLMKDAADGELLWTTGADMDAAEAILWLEAYYKNELKKQADLIADGTLIRRDELVKFLNERLLDEEKGVRWNMHNDGSAVTVVQNILNHINKSR